MTCAVANTSAPSERCPLPAGPACFNPAPPVARAEKIEAGSLATRGSNGKSEAAAAVPPQSCVSPPLAVNDADKLREIGRSRWSNAARRANGKDRGWKLELLWPSRSSPSAVSARSPRWRCICRAAAARSCADVESSRPATDRPVAALPQVRGKRRMFQLRNVPDTQIAHRRGMSPPAAPAMDLVTRLLVVDNDPVSGS